jgi:hypothetical protein
MSLDVLRTEIITDPLSRGYAGMTAEQVAASLNAKNRSRNRTSMSATEVLNAINVTEFNAKTAEQKQQIWDVLHIGTLNPFGVEAQIFTSIFGGGSTTIQALAGMRMESISRAEEIGTSYVPVLPGHVEEVRR